MILPQQQPEGVKMKNATEKQIQFITRLMLERNLEPLNAQDLEGFTVAHASIFIEQLLKTPKAQAQAQAQAQPKAQAKPKAVAVSQVGMYQTPEGVIFKVQRSKQSGNLYAKQLNASGRGFTYAQGAIYSLTPEMAMTLEEAQAFGVRTGNCCVCGRELTDPASVAQGIGPVCVQYFG